MALPQDALNHLKGDSEDRAETGIKDNRTTVAVLKF